MLKVKVTVAMLVMAAFSPAFTHAHQSTLPSDAGFRQMLDRNPRVVL